MKLKSLFLLLIFSSFLAHAEINKSLRNYVSAECNTLIGIDMKSIMSIPAMNLLLQSADSDEIKQMNEMGLKPQDVESVIIGLNSNALAANPMAFEKQPELISISRVKDGITLDKLIQAAQANKVTVKEEQIDNVRSVIMTKDGKEFVMSQLDEKVIAIGSRKMVKKAISLKGSSAGNVNENAELQKLADKQKDMFWVVGAAPVSKAPADPNQPLDNPMVSMFGDLRMFTLSIGFGQEAVVLNSDLICKDAEGANKLAVTAQLMTGFLAAAEDSPVRPEQIKFSQNESTVNVKISLDPASLMKAAAAAKGLAEE